MILRHRLAGAEERMDAPGADRRDLAASLDHIGAVNRWLGGTRSVLKHLPSLLPPAGRSTRVLEVGTGNGNIARAIGRWAARNGRRVRIAAVDNHPDTLEIARDRSVEQPEIRLLLADARRLPFADGSFDAGCIALTLHHFEGPEQSRVLAELSRVCRGNVLVAELERSWRNYLGALALAGTVWARNPLTRHDGPLSVRRSFRAPELLELGRAAGLRSPRVRRHFFGRLVLIAGGSGSSRGSGGG